MIAIYEELVLNKNFHMFCIQTFHKQQSQTIKSWGNQNISILFRENCELFVIICAYSSIKSIAFWTVYLLCTFPRPRYFPSVFPTTWHCFQNIWIIITCKKCGTNSLVKFKKDKRTKQQFKHSLHFVNRIFVHVMNE